MMSSRHVLYLSAFLLSQIFITVSDATQITATAFGSATPATTTDQSQVIQNGDFGIFRTNPLPVGDRGYVIGDGVNEFTRWNFDFTQDPNFFLFDTSMPLTTAELLIRLVPKGADFNSDFVRIDSLPNMSISNLAPVFTINTPLEIHIDLLTLHSSNVLLGIFNAHGGIIAMRYEDDAILTEARLVLSNSVPEPSTYLLTGISLLALAAFHRSKMVLS